MSQRQYDIPEKTYRRAAMSRSQRTLISGTTKSGAWNSGECGLGASAEAGLFAGALFSGQRQAASSAATLRAVSSVVSPDRTRTPTAPALWAMAVSV